MFSTRTYLCKHALTDLEYHTSKSHQKQIVLGDHRYFSQRLKMLQSLWKKTLMPAFAILCLILVPISTSE